MEASEYLKRLREKKRREGSPYYKQANDFCLKYGISIQVEKMIPAPCPQWGKPAKKTRFSCPSCGSVHGAPYWVTISRDGKKASFTFWTSHRDTELNLAPQAYNILSCVSGDINNPGSFSSWCSEYGYDTDSISAKNTWERCIEQYERLKPIFNDKEIIEALQEIQ